MTKTEFLEQQACKFAARMWCAVLREPARSERKPRLMRIAVVADRRAIRRYQRLIESVKATACR